MRLNTFKIGRCSHTFMTAVTAVSQIDRERASLMLMIKDGLNVPKVESRLDLTILCRCVLTKPCNNLRR